MELKCAGMKGALEPGDELASEHAAEYLNGQKEAAGRADPSGVVRREPACSQNTVSMRVKLQSLIPGVQDAEEADLRTQMMRIAGHLQQRLRTGMKEQVEDHFLVLQGQRCQFAWQGEYRVDVASGQEFPFPRREPAQASVALAPRAMPIAARVIGDGDVTAVCAAIAMTAEHSRTAAQDSQQDLAVLPGNPALTLFQESLSCTADDVGHL